MEKMAAANVARMQLEALPSAAGAQRQPKA